MKNRTDATILVLCILTLVGLLFWLDSAQSQGVTPAPGVTAAQLAGKLNTNGVAQSSVVASNALQLGGVAAASYVTNAIEPVSSTNSWAWMDTTWTNLATLAFSAGHLSLTSNGTNGQYSHVVYGVASSTNFGFTVIGKLRAHAKWSGSSTIYSGIWVGTTNKFYFGGQGHSTEPRFQTGFVTNTSAISSITGSTRLLGSESYVRLRVTGTQVGYSWSHNGVTWSVEDFASMTTLGLNVTGCTHWGVLVNSAVNTPIVTDFEVLKVTVP